MKYCPECNSDDVPKSMKRCPFCGYAFSEQKEEKTIPVRQQTYVVQEMVSERETEQREERVVEQVSKFDIRRFSEESNEPDYIKARKAFIAEDFTNARLYFANSYRRGNILAGIKLGQMHYFGEGGAVDYKSALKLFMEGSDCGYPLATEWVSESYRLGKGVPKDENKAEELSLSCRADMMEMCACEDSDAQYMHGWNLLFGIFCEREEEKGFYWLNRAAEEGHLSAMVKVADCYLKGKGCIQDIEKGLSMMKQLAATTSSRNAHYYLGEMYFFGDYVEQNYKKAFPLLQFAAEKEHVTSMRYMGDFYYYGYEIEKDYEKARKWYEKSSDAGNATAADMLGDMYFFGKGVEENESTAFSYYKLAADRGNRFSQYSLHYYYLFDEKYKNYELGRVYLEKAAQQGHAAAQRELALMYIGNYGFDDNSKFIYWLKLAAENGDTEAQRILGEAYYQLKDEDVLSTSYPDAVLWLEKAAEGNDFDAMLDLARLYGEGIGMQKDLQKSEKFLGIASQRIVELLEDNNDIGKKSKEMADIYYEMFSTKEKHKIALEYYSIALEWGNTMIPCQWDDAWPFKEGLAMVKKDEKYGYIDKYGAVIIPCQWDDTWSFGEGLAMVKREGKYGYIDKNGTIVIPCRLDDAWSFSEGLAMVKREGKYGYIDKNGTEVIPCQWDNAWSFSEGLAKIKAHEKFGYIDKDGKVVIPCQWNAVWSFQQGLALVAKDGKYGYINREGKVMIPCQWDDAGHFKEGLAMVKKNGKYGYIDKNGKLVIPIELDEELEFSDGLAKIKKDEKYGYMDSSGKIVISCQFEKAYDFNEGLAMVKKDGKWIWINKAEQVVLIHEWDRMGTKVTEGLVNIQKEKKWGYININKKCDYLEDLLYKLGMLYFVDGVTSSLVKLTKEELLFYISESEAKAENSNLAYLLGVVYDVGCGIEKDYKEAEQWYLKAIKKGSLTSRCNLATIYINKWQKMEKGFELLEEANRLGSIQGTRLLAQCYKSGIGTKKNRSMAKKLFKEAAECGDKEAAEELKKFWF